MAGVQEPDGCNHGGVAVPVAVLFGNKMRQNIPIFTWMRVRFEPVTHREREVQAQGFSGHGYRDDITIFLNNWKTKWMGHLILK